jgi:branched-chain amino acid transport system substrate-binding protein
VETYRTGDLDFRPQLRKVAAKKPDILVVGALLAEAVRIVVQARQAGVASHVIGGNGFNSPRFIELAGNAGEGAVFGAAYFAGNAYAGNGGFVQRYVRRFGMEPDQFSAQAYAAAQIAAAAVKSGATTSAGICTALKKLALVSTVLGPVNFLPSRELHAASAIVVVSKGSFVYFSGGVTDLPSP